MFLDVIFFSHSALNGFSIELFFYFFISYLQWHVHSVVSSEVVIRVYGNTVGVSRSCYIELLLKDERRLLIISSHILHFLSPEIEESQNSKSCAEIYTIEHFIEE